MSKSSSLIFEQRHNNGGNDGRQGPNKKEQPRSRERATQACNQCRLTRSRCLPSGHSGACQMCFRLGIDCQFNGPNRKRGPTKGHLNDLENRLAEMESIIGLLQMMPCTQIQGIFQELGRDPGAARTLERIAHGPYGPFGRDLGNEDMEFRDRLERKGESHTSDVYPSSAWQDRVIARLRDIIDDPEVDEGDESREGKAHETPAHIWTASQFRE
ncbi:hypothetical protein SISNIDRAFT_460131 [Sistotremastrum niveocremeum HHB9708]|uniref:Zn(2)-C6 fungal-type domain-containing protein n=2 Tax=Sistotremastraceae TaxID=3402574 RepID=A0A164NVB0_9AGAM|nr:hypothetical protein SISNIDRAFT_460131 [Sistotremastrum niveocremeum HHB9708]KZT40501.1 hypothetical protein SISSUDRAFT_1044218 [Sistotremastrum suecicum HHB10207 ss-3]